MIAIEFYFPGGATKLKFSDLAPRPDADWATINGGVEQVNIKIETTYQPITEYGQRTDNESGSRTIRGSSSCGGSILSFT